MVTADAIEQIPESLMDGALHFAPGRNRSARGFFADVVRADFRNDLDSERRYQRHHDQRVRSDPPFASSIGAHAVSLGRSAASLGIEPSKAVDCQDEIEAVARFLATLSPYEEALGRECLLAEVPLKEFAERHGVRLSSAKRHLHELRKKLNERFPQDG
jgi:RNA polymerase sigma factor (sigma-70 family)